ncbi:MAG: FAD/NAD(P)-binding protein [Thermoplasmata archaeon]
MNSMAPLNTEILDIKEETADVKSFLLQNVFDVVPNPGQFYELSVMGYGEVPISLASSKNGLLFSIKKVGKVTEIMHKMHKGDRIGIRGPYGTGFPEPDGATVLIAGGIGLPPARSYIEHSLVNNNKNMMLLYGARSPEDIVYRQEIERWNKMFNVYVSVDNANKEWKGNVGVVTKLFNRITNIQSKFIIIGPTIMIKFSVIELKKMGVEDDNIYLSLERKMKCGVGLCGHCNIGRYYVCKDGPVFSYSKVKDIPELFF